MSYTGLLVGAFLLNAVLVATVAAKPLKAPRGWDESIVDNNRVLSKGKTRISISRWQSLDGRSVEAYLSTASRRVSGSTEFISAGEVTAVEIPGTPGIFKVTRKIKWFGQTSSSILFGCPGQPGYTRLMDVSFTKTEDENASDAVVFALTACLEEPKGGAAEAIAGSAQGQSFVSIGNSQAAGVIGSGDPALENSKIPAGNRPVSTVVITKIVMQGFNPVIPVPVPRMVSTYPNGYSTTCTKWDMVKSEPTPQSIGSKKCELSKDIPQSWGGADQA